MIGCAYDRRHARRFFLGKEEKEVPKAGTRSSRYCPIISGGLLRKGNGDIRQIFSTSFYPPRKTMKVVAPVGLCVLIVAVYSPVQGLPSREIQVLDIGSRMMLQPIVGIKGCTSEKCNDQCKQQQSSAPLKGSRCLGGLCECDFREDCTPDKCREKCKEQKPDLHLDRATCESDRSCACSYFENCNQQLCLDTCRQRRPDVHVTKAICKSNQCECTFIQPCSPDVCQKECDKYRKGYKGACEGDQCRCSVR